MYIIFDEAHMPKISFLYPNKHGAKFDMDYYLGTHMPLAIHLMSRQPGFRTVLVERGVKDIGDNADVAYLALCHYTFDSVKDFNLAYAANASRLKADMPNFTDIQPLIQINEVVIEKHSRRNCMITT
jgi:uncharacterized protein (TIGR02118 family)